MASRINFSSNHYLNSSHDNSSLTLQNCSAEIVRLSLSGKPLVTTLILEGNWSDREFLSFIPLMKNVNTLVLKRMTISDNALSEALLHIAKENPFEGLYEEQKNENLSEWTTDPIDFLSLEEVAKETFFDNLPAQRPLALPSNTLRLPKLQHLTIESPKSLTSKPLKLIAPKLTSLTLKNWPQSSLSEEDRSLFQKNLS